MRTKILAFLVSIALFSTGGAWAASSDPAKVGSKTNSAHKHRRSKAKKVSWRTRGQKQIADERTREIQVALVREGYLSGEPTGVLDAQTKAALMRLQKENGWQARIVPDSRALIKLGLGPDQSKILNPDSAALATPVSSTASAASQQ